MNAEEVTSAVWVTRKRTTVLHIRGLLQQLEAVNALDYAQVTILPVSFEESAVVLPAELVGREVILTDDNLPVEGLLFVPE